MKTRFRIGKRDTITAYLYAPSGKLLTSIYDSGYTKLAQVYRGLLQKAVHPPKGTKFSVKNETKDTYWSNR